MHPKLDRGDSQVIMDCHPSYHHVPPKAHWDTSQVTLGCLPGYNVDDVHQAAFSNAVEYEHLKSMGDLVGGGADVNKIYGYRTLKFLIEKEADVNSLTYLGTPLMRTAIKMTMNVRICCGKQDLM